MATSWATSPQAIRHWPDAASVDATRLSDLLEAATIECRAFVYGPDALPAADPGVIPTNYVVATVYQARELYAATTRDGDVIGAGDLAIRSRPLIGTVKQLLRPESRGGVG